MADQYDLVITGGRVIDPETKLDGKRNVGVKDGKIAAVTEAAIEGKETIDATGHVVAPGFIDMHFHNAGIPFGQKLGLRDGLTTPMELELGVCPVDKWYASLEGKSRTHYGATVGSVPARETILNPDFQESFSGYFLLDAVGDPAKAHTSMNWSTVVASPEQIEKIEGLLDKGLQQGALGVGHAAGYMEYGCTQQESVIVQKMAAKYGRSAFLHGRFSSQMPPTTGLLAMFELMAPQEVYGGGLVVQHIHAQALRDTVTALDIIGAARKKGVDVIGEIYPYEYGASIVAADYLRPDNYGPNMGRSYKDIIRVADMKPYDKDSYESDVKTAPLTPIMFYNAKLEDVYKGLSHPACVVGSDAYIYTDRKSGKLAADWDTPFDSVNGHPRGAGTHARVLAWTREKKLDISLSDAVSKMTYMIANYLQHNGVAQMANKGRIQEGKDADITIFDPETVQDNATMDNSAAPSTGIPYVLVNGTVMVRDSKTVDDVFPGQPIRC